MAKNKKEMIPEERLAAALVPEEEQPYELPDGWKWVHLGGILDVSKKKMEEFTPDTKYVGLQQFTAFKPLAHRPKPMLAKP